MSEWHVEVVRVGPIEKHPNADSLSITQVHGGYPVIFKTGDFAEGDLGIYVPIDSVVPDVPAFSFLERRRIKAKKLRGVYSQGLLLPISPNGEIHLKLAPDGGPVTPGTLVHELLDITKWEPDIEYIFTGGPQEPGPDGWDFIKYTDIEGLRRYKGVLDEDEEVVITEKIHGCVTAQTRVTMSDGSKKKITDIVVGDEVLGVDCLTNRVQPTCVIKTWNNGKAETWLRVQVTRKHVKSGNSFIRVICTPQHKFFLKNQEKFVEAGKLEVGDTVLIQGQEFFTQLVEQTVTSISDVTDSEKSLRYDLETELHNYFANEILVHNSNGRFCWDGERLWAGSRNQIKKEDEGTFWWKVAKEMKLQERLSREGCENIIFFGEVYGKGVQDLSYDVPGLSFVVFDTFDVKKCKFNDWDTALELTEAAGLPRVPYLYRGPWKGFEAHKELAEGKSTVAGHVREGFVVKPVKERFANRFGRVILKLVGQDYLLR